MNMDTCDQIIDMVKNCTDENEFISLISPLVIFYEPLTFCISNNALWRARKIEEARFSKTREMSHPPSKLTPVGRLNNFRKPVFYAAFDLETAIRELNPSIGDFIQIARFDLLPSNNLKLGSVGEYFHIDKNNNNFIKEEKVTSCLKMEMYFDGDVKTRLMTKIDQLFFEIFTDPNAKSRDYIFSRQLKLLIYKKLRGEIDGFIYRSCKKPDGFNIAIEPNHLAKSVVQNGCWIFKITKKRQDGIFEWKEINVAIGIDKFEEFIWKN